MRIAEWEKHKKIMSLVRITQIFRNCLKHHALVGMIIDKYYDILNKL